MILTTEESNGAVTGTHHHPQSAEFTKDDTDDGEDAVSPDTSSRETLNPSPSSREALPLECPHA